MIGILIGTLSLIAGLSYLWFLVLAFRKSVGWGFAVLLIPFVQIYFATKNWTVVKKPFLLHVSTALAAFILFVISVFMPTGGGLPLESTIQLAKETKNEGPQKNKIDADPQAVAQMEQKIKVMEKLPKSQKQQQFLGAMRKYVLLKRTAFTDLQVSEYRKELVSLLNRTDLNKSQRQDFKKMIAALNQKKDGQKKDGQKKGVAVTKGGISLRQASKISPDGQNALPAGSAGEIITVRTPRKKVVQRRKKERFSKKSDRGTVPFRFDADESGGQRPRYRRIPFAQAKKHIGSPITFIGPMGGEKECLLVGVAHNSLKCRKVFNDGTFSFSFKKSEIKSLKVLRQ